MGPLRCAANLLVKISESRKRWSGRRKCWVADGLGNAAYAIAVVVSVGLWEGALSIFLGSRDIGGEWRTSV